MYAVGLNSHTASGVGMIGFASIFDLVHHINGNISMNVFPKADDVGSYSFLLYKLGSLQQKFARLSIGA
jgi:hypothetical protein